MSCHPGGDEAIASWGSGRRWSKLCKYHSFVFFHILKSSSVFLVFPKGPNQKIFHLPPENQHVTLFFLLGRWHFLLTWSLFWGTLRSFSGGSNWFPRCELPVYHRSGWLWHHPLPAWAGELNKQSGMVKTWSFQSVDLQRDKVRSRRR